MFTISSLAGGLAFIFCLLTAAPARAQETFGDLGQKVREGQKVIVIDQQGAMTKGRVESVSATALVVDYGQGRIPDPSLATTRTFKPADVQKVQKPGHLWDGAIKGAFIGAIPGVLAMTADCYDCRYGAFTLFTTGVGAAVGVGIDALFGPKTVFRGSARPPRIALAPIVGRERRGVSASFRF
jgi:hypothetical protein